MIEFYTCTHGLGNWADCHECVTTLQTSGAIEKNSKGKLDFLAKIAENIRVYRARKRITQSELAKKAGVSQATIAQIESLRKSPSLESLNAIATAMNTPICRLLEAP